jgi:hypothetical protein
MPFRCSTVNEAAKLSDVHKHLNDTSLRQLVHEQGSCSCQGQETPVGHAGYRMWHQFLLVGLAEPYRRRRRAFRAF